MQESHNAFECDTKTGNDRSVAVSLRAQMPRLGLSKKGEKGEMPMTFVSAKPAAWRHPLTLATLITLPALAGCATATVDAVQVDARMAGDGTDVTNHVTLTATAPGVALIPAGSPGRFAAEPPLPSGTNVTATAMAEGMRADGQANVSPGNPLIPVHIADTAFLQVEVNGRPDEQETVVEVYPKGGGRVMERPVGPDGVVGLFQAPGEYRVRAVVDGTDFPRHDVRLTAGKGETLTLDTNFVSATINVALVPPGPEDGKIRFRAGLKDDWTKADFDGPPNFGRQRAKVSDGAIYERLVPGPYEFTARDLSVIGVNLVEDGLEARDVPLEITAEGPNTFNVEIKAAGLTTNVSDFPEDVNYRLMRRDPDNPTHVWSWEGNGPYSADRPVIRLAPKPGFTYALAAVDRDRNAALAVTEIDTMPALGETLHVSLTPGRGGETCVRYNGRQLCDALAGAAQDDDGGR